MIKRSAIALVFVLVLSGLVLVNNENTTLDGIQLPIDNIGQEKGELDLKNDQMPGYGHFIENKGQWSPDIRFLASTDFGHIGLGKDCVFFDLREITEKEIEMESAVDIFQPIEMEEEKIELEINGYVVKYTFEGARDIEPIGIDPLVQTNNYFIGNDPNKWARGARTFQNVIYRGLYEDIDLKYYFNEQGPKYDFILNPGSEPDDIMIRVEGHESLKMNENGMSVLLPNGRTLSDTGLISFYDDQKNSMIETDFEFIDTNTFKFDLNNYDSNKKVIVDPLIYCTYIGTSGYDHSVSFKVGRNERVYFYAVTMSDSFPTSPGAYDDSHHTGKDLIVFIMDNDASEILNATYIGGDGDDGAGDFFLDETENFILTGGSSSTDFPTTAGAFQTTYGGSGDRIVLKLLNNCTDLIYSTYIGGSMGEGGRFLVDSNGDVYLSGHTSSGDFPTTSEAYDTGINGGSDIYAMKMKNDGSDAIFSTFIGGQDNDPFEEFYLDSNGDIFITGRTKSTDFPTTTGSYDTSYNGGDWDCFALKLKGDGSDLIFSTFLGGGLNEGELHIGLDSAGDLIMNGYTQSTDFPITNGAFNEAHSGTWDIFVLKMKGNGSDITHSTFIGGSNYDFVEDWHIADNNDIYITGFTTSNDFPTTLGAYDTSPNGNEDCFLLKLKNDFSDLEFSTFIGGSNEDKPYYLHVNNYGDIFVNCKTYSNDFPTTEDAIDDSNGGDGDQSFLQMNHDGSELKYSTFLGGNNEDSAKFFQDDLGTVYAVGITTSTDLPTTPDGISDDFMGEYDIFIYKFTLEMNTEPTEVYTVDAYSEPNFSGQITMVDKGQSIYVELVGLDGNTSHRDNALVEVSFRWTPLNGFNLPLKETGNDTGIYRGDFTVPFSIDFFEEIMIRSKKDPTKFDKLFIDSPFRPVSVSSLDIYTDPGFSFKSDKIDIGQDIYVKVVGEDASPLSTDFAFVNITKNENETYLLMERLEETGDNTGIYTGSFPAPSTFVYFDNITLYSVRNHDMKDTFMVHTPLQIRPFFDNNSAIEDEEYRESYWNFGYEAGTWSMDTLADWLNWDSEKNEISGTPDNGDVGPWDVWLTLEDGKGHIEEREFQIIVGNSEPEILTDDVLVGKEGELYIVDYNSTDDDQGVITWSIISYSTWLTIDEGAGILSGIPTHAEIGRHAISVIVDDGNGGTDRSSFDVEVRGFNKPPEILSMDITTGTQGELYFRDYEAHDPNEYDTLEWFLNTTASFLSIENDTGIVTGTPGAEDHGVFHMNVTVKDQDGLMDSHIFDLTVENINDMPYWGSIPDDADIYHGQHFIFDVDALDYDLDSVLQYSIRSKPESNITIDPDTGEIDWVASVTWFNDDNFEMEITIEVSDGELFRLHKFTITILPTESPTVQLTGPDDGSRTPSTDTVLEWEGSDPENEPITYDIYIHESQAFIDGLREEALHLEGYEGESFTVSGLTQGKMYYWTIRPNDGCSYGACTDGRRSFVLNNPPKMDNIPDQEISSGSEFKVRVSTSDDDDQDKGNLVHSLVDHPEGMRISEDTGTIRWTPNNDQGGWHTITVGVSDGVETSVKTFDIEVIESEESEFPIMVVVAVAGVIVLIIIAVLVFLLIRKREPTQKEEKEEEVDEDTAEIMKQMEDHKKEEQWEKGYLDHKEEAEEVTSDVPLSASDAHAHDKDRRHDSLGYEELYGTKAPEIEEGDVSTEELRDTIKETADKLEQMEPPVEDDNFLDNLISHAHKESEDIVHRGQEDEIDDLKIVDRSYADQESN